MRNLQKMLAFFGILATSMLGQLVGCADDANNCELNLEACPSAGSSSSSGTVMPPPGCTESPSKNADVIRSDCAYFVGGMNAKAGNTGGEADPFVTLAEAVTAAKSAKARVYLCGSADERVDVPAGVSIFGGFDCSQTEWKYDVAMPGSIAPAAPAMDAPFQSSIRISGAGTTNVEDINIVAANAGFAGGSSIAVIVDKATANFVRANLTAGNGQNGADGATPSDDIGPLTNVNDPAILGNNGANACTGGSMGNPGGAAKANPVCGESVGGQGGAGKDLTAAEAGASGTPAMAGSGVGGAGEDASVCVAGTQGAGGSDGNSGMGATDIGQLSATGYTGSNGTSGGKGAAGQGGGGGGGAKGKSSCNGASGGSGGAGGCPGNGGTGGGAGGASIGIVSVGASLTFSAAKIQTSTGGNGGAGGGGQTGATGGGGGLGGEGAKNPMSTKFGCDGGKGGRGGNGGNGGGGLGGHSIGIAIKKGSAMPDISGVDIKTGSAGTGGTGTDAVTTGGNGTKDNTHELN